MSESTKTTLLWWIAVPAALVILPRLLGKRAWEVSGTPPGSFSQQFRFTSQGPAFAKANELTAAGWIFVRVQEVSV